MITRQRLGPAAVLALAAASHAAAQCGTSGPDAVIGDVGAATSFAAQGGVAAFGFGATVCNRGDGIIRYEPTTSRHPVIVTNLYRLRQVSGHYELDQVGMSWAFNTFFALSGTACCPDCQPAANGNLGTQCSSPESASIMAAQQALAPRTSINPYTGAFPYPPPSPEYSGSLARRMQVKVSDIDPALNAGALYFAELQVVTPDDAGAASNNVSYRRVGVSGAGTTWNLTPMSGAVVGESALAAWSAADPACTVVAADIPGHGRVEIAAAVTQTAPRRWHYEIAVRNHSLWRGIQAITMPAVVPASISGFSVHDVAYHSGDGLNNQNVEPTPWLLSQGCSGISFSTTPYASNPNANAIRWSTAYTIRFDATTPPRLTDDVQLTGYLPGEPIPAIAASLPMPRGVVDVDGDGVRTPVDIAVYVSQWLASLTGGSLNADLDENGAVEPSDLALFIQLWFAAPC
ncbi:MAG: hypothetical protein KF745_15455 [Phycisphaeraceae bacterium]|nr:hypothetical protein [Phycisphaeraceae bacterium]